MARKNLTRADFFDYMVIAQEIYDKLTKEQGEEPTINEVLKGSPLSWTEAVWMVFRYGSGYYGDQPALKLLAQLEVAWAEHEQWMESQAA